MIRHAARALARAAAVALLACGLLGPGATRADEPARPVLLEVDAPEPLRALLLRHLDLARVPLLAADTPLDEAEWARLVGATPAQARQLLETEGYFNPDVQIERPPVPPEAASRLVRLRVQPGTQARVGRLRLEVQGDLSRIAETDPKAAALVRGLRERWSLPAGAPFRDEAWTAAKNALLAQLRGAGYSAALMAGTAAQVRTESDSADLFVVADSGPLFRAGDLVINGLVHHDEATVRALAGFERGTPLTEELLLDFQERLQTADLFDSVVLTVANNPARADTARVTVRVREQPLQQATVAVGVSANTGPRTTLEHRHRRPFGWAAIASNKLEVGRDLQSWEGDLTSHPQPGFYRNLIGGAVLREIGDTDVVGSQRLRVGRTQDTKRIERLAFVELERATRTTDTERDRATALSLNYHGVWRNVDSVVLPTDGESVALQGGVGQSRSLNDGSGPYMRLWGRVNVWRPLGASWYGTARLEMGQVFTRGRVGVPETQLFRAGGDDSVRGYDYRTLAPIEDDTVVGGAVVATGSLEVARPIIARLPSIWGAVFVDAGRAARSWSGIDPAVGVGVGVRWRSPVGPLRLDVARGLEARQWRFHLNVGIAF